MRAQSPTIVTALSLAISILLFMSACGSPSIETGVIIDRKYDDADSYMTAGIQIPGSCSTTNNITTCSPGVYIPGHWVDEPEQWLLRLQDGDRRSWVSVPESIYYSAKNGQWYDSKTGEVTSR